MTQVVVAIPGTTLFRIASEYLGDATQWSRIALVNNLNDPYLTTSMSLTLPIVRNESNKSNGS